LLGFIFGKLPLQHLPLARIKFCVISPAFVPAKKQKKEAVRKTEELDRFYVVKTNIQKENLNTQTAHKHFKNFANIKFSFRIRKTKLEKI